MRSPGPSCGDEGHVGHREQDGDDQEIEHAFRHRADQPQDDGHEKDEQEDPVAGPR